MIKTVSLLFPEIELDPSKFTFQPSRYLGRGYTAFTTIKNSNTMIGSYWKDVTNRRKMFTDLASEMGFDPLVPANWYSVSSYAVLSCKVVSVCFPIIFKIFYHLFCINVGCGRSLVLLPRECGRCSIEHLSRDWAC